ncbi:uncharacterized protein A4U43_C08F21600 [Asparagus officinalis]|nr:uncharacterized protein A4U43_C08F21600 [Asparagus officinalis]
MALALRKSISLFFLIIFSLDVRARGVESRWSMKGEEDLELEKQLKVLNKPPVKSFQSKSGHIYDCIDIYKQPAFDNPLLKDHKLQMWPSSFPEGMPIYSNLRQNSTCPSGTALIRRTTMNDLIYAKTLQNHVKSHGANVKSGINDGSHYAIMKTDVAEYYGASAKLIVYGFPNVKLDQVTISQIWVIGGAGGPEDKMNTVQAGWHVYPDINGDSLTHLSTFWTADGYKTGCFNFNCPGFVALSPDFGPGSEITELSVYGGIQKSIEISIFKDQKTGNWWLTYGHERSFVGYWPKELFNNLDKATEVDYGGAVYSPINEPSPPMGSGHLVEEGPNKTCYFLNVQLVNERNELYDPEDNNVHFYADILQYYDIDYGYESGTPDGYQFSYGGPGGYTH